MPLTETERYVRYSFLMVLLLVVGGIAGCNKSSTTASGGAPGAKMAPMPGAKPFKQEALPAPDKELLNKQIEKSLKDSAALSDKKAENNAGMSKQ